MKNFLKCPKTGRFISSKNVPIVNGRLYDFGGLVVRARKELNNGTRLVSIHNKLFGFVKDSELKKIDVTRVKEYLAKV